MVKKIVKTARSDLKMDQIAKIAQNTEYMIARPQNDLFLLFGTFLSQNEPF